VRLKLIEGYGAWGSLLVMIGACSYSRGSAGHDEDRFRLLVVRWRGAT